jgi:LDH2 family malate/lactate/ureidoglycolate dehydrogenase
MPDVGPFPVAALTDLVGRLLAAAGATPDEAALVAEHVVDAEARENRSQGLIRIPPYVSWARSRPDVREILVPGEGSAARGAAGRRDGVAVAAELCTEIVVLARQLKVEHALVAETRGAAH